MNRFIALVSLVLLACGPVRAEEAKSTADPARIAAARELMEVTGVTKQLDSMMDIANKSFAKGANADGSDAGKQMSAEFAAAMEKFKGYQAEMLNDFAVLYAETFTADEMKEISKFYASGTGAKFITAMPGLMQKGSEIGMKYSQRMMQDIGAAAGQKK